MNAQEVINEQEDRIEESNSVILANECRAFQKRQIEEKQSRKEENQKESLRLDKMMEEACQKADLLNEKKNLSEHERNKRYGDDIRQQIKDHEIEKLLQAEKTAEEGKMLNRALIAMQREDQEKMEAHILEQHKLRDEYDQANLDHERYKFVQKEEQRVDNLRIQEVTRQRAACEEAREAELALIKKAWQKEISRLGDEHHRAHDKEVLMDKMQTIRFQEEIEQGWIEKDKQTAIKHAEEIEDLNEARSQQILDIKEAKAMDIARDKASFQNDAKLQREYFERDEEKKALRKEVNIQHGYDVLKQIKEKERERKIERNEHLEDGKAFRLSQEFHDYETFQCKKAPDHYANDI